MENWYLSEGDIVWRVWWVVGCKEQGVSEGDVTLIPAWPHHSPCHTLMVNCVVI